MRKRAPPGSFGYRVWTRREHKKLTQTQLSAKAGIGQSAISSIETGDVQWSRGRNLLRLAAALDCDPTWLETGVGDPEANPDLPDAAFLAIYAELTAANRRLWLAAGRGILAEQSHQEATKDNPFPGVAKAVPKP